MKLWEELLWLFYGFPRRNLCGLAGRARESQQTMAEGARTRALESAVVGL